jgi:saccharopine dehydrogenase-like NADP-dependent oxidoreductase
MRLLIVGTGGVGESVAVLAARRDPEGGLFERVVLADADLARAERVSRRLGEQRFPAERVDGTDPAAIAALAAKHRADVVCNFLPLWANVHVMEAALQAGTHYLDTAFGVDPEPLPDGGERPWFDAFQFDYQGRFESIGRLALLGQGVEPGMADYFARYAADHYFDEVEEMGVRDGSNLAIPGFEGIAFGFSAWSTIDELTCPAIVWEAGKGISEVPPFSEKEPFFLPEGIGTVDVGHVAHDEVVHISRNAGLLKGVRKATFKYGLGDEFEAAMGVLKSLNLHEVEPVEVAAADGRHVMVAPRDLVAAACPDPAEIGKHFIGKTAAGLWVKGRRDGLERELYLYQVADNQDCLETFGTQAVVCQTAFTAVITLELLATGRLAGYRGNPDAGVRSPEEFCADPYVALMSDYGFPGGVMEMDSEHKRAGERGALVEPS